MFDFYLLDLQHRMAPACSKFPRMEFYDGKGLKDSDEVNGTSLVIHANGDSIVDMIDRLILTKGVRAARIKVLTYYQGQRRLIRQLINSRLWDRDVKDAIDISRYQKRLLIGETKVWFNVVNDYTESYWEPYEQACQRYQEALQDHTAFRGEMLKQENVMRDVNRIIKGLQSLSSAVSKGDDDSVVVEKRDTLLESWRQLFDLGRD